jgi:phage terminase large subunit
LSIVKQKRNISHKPFFEDTSRWVISYGGAGSAKSYSTAQKLLTRLLEEENHKILVVRKVATTLRVSVFQLFKDLISSLELFSDFKINKSDMTITNIHNNSMILFFGLDNIEKLKSIQGITSIWVEEASETERADILELNRRLRGETPYYKQIILTFNPISHLHWLKEHFFDSPYSKANIYKTTYLNNNFIDDEYKAEIEDIKNYDIQQYNIYALGEWGVLNTNIVYHKYDFTKHHTDKTINDFNVLHIGMDFNVGGCACVVSGIHGDTCYILDYFAPYDTEGIVTELMSRYKNKDLVLYPDASGKNESANASRSNIAILEQAGYRINANSKNPPVRDRINSVNRMFSLDKLLVNEKLDKVSFALQTQAYLDNGKPEKYDQHNGGSIDDINDALGYLIFTKFGLTKPRFTIGEHSFG